MNAVLDNLDLVLKAFGYTVFLFLVSAVISLLLGTVLAAMRVGPVSVLRIFGTGYVTLVRNTPLVMIFLFFQLGAGKIFDALRFSWVSIHIGTFDFTSFFSAGVAALSLYTAAFICEAIRAGVNAVPLGPGRGRSRDRTALHRRDVAGRAAPGRHAPPCRRWPAH